MDPRIRIHSKKSWIRNTGFKEGNRYLTVPVPLFFVVSYVLFRSPVDTLESYRYCIRRRWVEGGHGAAGCDSSRWPSSASTSCGRSVSIIAFILEGFYQCCGSGSESGSSFFGPPGSGCISQRYGSGSGSRFFYHQAKIVRKPWFLLLCDFFLTFCLWKWCKCTFKKYR
jgi:hypothetical protein